MSGKDFFGNRSILFLGLVTTGLALLNALLIIVRVDFSDARAILRHWLTGGTSQFDIAEPIYLYSFMILAFVVLISSWAISYKNLRGFSPGGLFYVFSGSNSARG